MEINTRVKQAQKKKKEGKKERFSRNEHTLGEKNEKRCLKLKTLVCSAIQHHPERGIAGMALGEAAGNGKNNKNNGFILLLDSVLLKRHLAQKKGIKFQLFSLTAESEESES